MKFELPLKLQVLLHLFLVYVSWGTTFLGFSLTLQVVGPFFACGFRMAAGGLILCLLFLITGKWQKLSAADLRHAAFFGLFLVVAASGFLSFGQQYLPSGAASVITGSTPITMIVAGWLFAGEERPSLTQMLGLLGGSCGLLLLAFEQSMRQTAGSHSLYGVFWVLCATFGWVAGSLLLRKYPNVSKLPALQDCGLLLLLGGLECIAIGLWQGEQFCLHFERLRPAIVLAFAWMVIGGAIIAYSSYFWLLSHVPISVAVSYEYVVPIIALALGAWLLDEEVSWRMLCASCLSIGSVFLILMHRYHR
ncbi:MAG: EamA family transporter [Desulfovibrio sp.]|nr:EamA family transporter [Desulfovibrio sp.]